MENRLIISNHKGHTAADLCRSATSWGPDFVGSDKQFCDMGSKTLLPLCSEQNVDDCVDIDQAGAVVTKRSIARRKVSSVKSYSKVSVWDGE